ncbi:MAG TPA: sigma factor-like helix-turn-helix DNA-binding protein [Gemmataceae bacterium]|nr:sigma factor-like helix-turn-helix DNA-binding protein [Gemmataceae bacterium]
MSSHLIFNEVDDAAKADLEKYWVRKKLPRLNKLLASYPPDRRDIWLTISLRRDGPQRDWYEARAVLHLPSGTLAAEADEKDPEVVLDLVADTLAVKIARHNKRVRIDNVRRRKARQRADLRAYAPLLRRDVENGRRADFFRLLRPLLGFLREHARHELRILELEGPLHRREVTVEDVLDEVLSLAWERFAKRPQHLPLDVWLTNLLHETLEQWIKQEPRPHVSLEETAEAAMPNDVPPMEARQEKEEKEWWDEMPPFEETPMLEDLIPDSAQTHAWDEGKTDDQQEQLWSLLAELPAVQRQAFMLHALEDFDTAEIAMLQDRPESDVKADIEAARRKLKEELRAGGSLQEAGKPAASQA